MVKSFESSEEKTALCTESVCYSSESTFAPVFALQISTSLSLPAATKKSSEVLVQLMHKINENLVMISSRHLSSIVEVNARLHIQMLPSLQSEAIFSPVDENFTIQTWSLCLESVAMHLLGSASSLQVWLDSNE